MVRRPMKRSNVDENSLAVWAVILIVAVIIWFVLEVIAEWGIFQKAGEKGWKALIPVYDVYVSHKIVGMSHIWFILEVIAWVIESVFLGLTAIPEWIDIAFGIPVAIITVTSAVIHAVKLCDCFGKGFAFEVGIILLPSVFSMIIAFGKAKYRKPKA